MIEWISHRGYCAREVENTEPAFRAAEAAGFRHIETDLRLTKDHQIILCHDENLERLTGHSLKISESTRNELESIRLANGSSLMFLDELLKNFSHLNWTFDIKEPDGSKTADYFSELIHQAGMTSWVESHVTFLAWSPLLEESLKREFPRARFYARIEECKRAGLANISGLSILSGINKDKVYSVSKTYLGFNLFNRTMVSRYHRQGAKVLAFLPNSEIELHQAVAAGFDQILSDLPPILNT